MDPIEAGKKGSAEIFFAVISTTVVLASVFIPVIFLQGLTGRLFREFGIVVAGSVIISAFVALTLTPMLSTRILKEEKSIIGFTISPNHFCLDEFCIQKQLTYFIERRWLAFPVVAVTLILVYFLFSGVKN